MAWTDEIPADLMVEADGKQVAMRDTQFVKDTPDAATFFKRAYDSHSEVGRRIPLKANDDAAKEAWRKEHLPKLYQAGLLNAPPASPKDYELMKPENMPEGITWSEDRANKLATTLHKHGIPKGAVKELMDLHMEALLGTQPEIQADYDKSIAALQKEHGAQYTERMELAKRLHPLIFQTPEDVAWAEATGMGNHLPFLRLMMRLAPLVQSDSSVMAELNAGGKGGGGKMTGDEARAALAAYADPKHPDHKAYMSGDPAISKKIDELYKQAHGTGTVTI